MIAFLTLLYVGLLFLLAKLGVIRWTLWWKISPVAWGVVLLVLLFLPMQWGAPAGPVILVRTVVEVVPNVAGEVVEVPAESLAPRKKGEVLFRIDPRPFQYQVGRLKADLDQARAEHQLAKLELERNEKAAGTSAVAARDVDVSRAGAAAAAARIASIESQVARAEFDLEQTTVHAPSDGYVLGLTLRPGQRVATAPLRGWMSFVDEGETYVLVGIQQYALRHVKPGQRAELIFHVRPGETFDAVVDSVVRFSSRGQVSPSGNVLEAPTRQAPQPFMVRLQLDDPDVTLAELPPGAIGSAAIYTDSVRATHLIRRVMIRMESLLNFIIPG